MAQTDVGTSDATLVSTLFCTIFLNSPRASRLNSEFFTTPCLLI